jgi:hypothetical protein
MANVDGRYVCQGVRWRSSDAVFPHWRSLPDHIELAAAPSPKKLGRAFFQK